MSGRPHPGSSWAEILNEPDWAESRSHQPGFKDCYGRYAGSSDIGDSFDETGERLRARKKVLELEKKAETGQLLNFREIVNEQKELEGFHLRNPKTRPPGWRYVSEFTEDWVKNGQGWPTNSQRHKQQQKREQEQPMRTSRRPADGDGKDRNFKRDTNEQEQDPKQTAAQENEAEREEKPLARFGPRETAFLRALQHEKDYISSLCQNDGKRGSPMHEEPPISIDEADQFTPDNWIPRSPDLIRLTGKFPLNAEPQLQKLYEAGLITPNGLHYVRSHGPVPRLVWEFHQIEIQAGKVKLSIEELKHDFDPINIPIFMACDNSRRKELNMIKRTKGFNWGAGGFSCAYWKGPLLHDVLLAAGIPKEVPDRDRRRYWIHFEGADELSEGRYATSIPFEYAMDPAKNVILAYEMNDLPLPPDHGYPVRLMIPGWVGGRCVKWLHKIWINHKENDSYYHIWDNRVIPGFITDTDSEFARLLFHHPDTACCEQILNSIIVKPGQGEKIKLTKAKKGVLYRIAGFAYGGSGRQIHRVEISLDNGSTWLYCIRTFPEAPIRHDNKFWTWVHWHIDVDIASLVRAESIAVRCTDSAKNTQPREPHWNILGSMNNCWYIVKPELLYEEEDSDSTSSCLLFRHPTEPGTGEGGWMKPSTVIQVAMAKQDADTSQKQFTREEIEKHNRDHDCWIVVNGKVYDATDVLSWHPGGKASILAHAGQVHQDTTDEYASIHDDYATQKLQGKCYLGFATEKTIKFIDTDAKRVKEMKDKSHQPTDRALERHRWTPIKLVGRKFVTHDTRCYNFQLPDGKPILGLGASQHLELAFHMEDQMLIRPYTPTRPLLPYLSPESRGTNNPHSDLRDGNGRSI